MKPAMNNPGPQAAAIPVGRALKPALMAAAMIAIAFSLPMLGAASAESTLTHLIGEGGVRGPAMFLLLATLLTAIGLPRQVPAFVAGYAFGAWDGAAIALVSQVFACAIDFTWSRMMGRAFVHRRFGPAICCNTGVPADAGWQQHLAEPGRRPVIGAGATLHRRLCARLYSADGDFCADRPGQRA
jgi:hypothetical protein